MLPIEILTKFPEFEDSPVTTLNVMLGLAAQRLSPKFFGAKFNQALAYFAGHLYKSVLLAEEGSGAGPVSSERAGEVARSYAIIAAQSSSDAPFNVTAYGRLFADLRRSCARGKAFSTYGFTQQSAGFR